ncbi:unnamed protein product [Laminaria digitata]
MRSSGVPKLIEDALERFGGTDQRFRDQATGALRCLARDPPAARVTGPFSNSSTTRTDTVFFPL